MIKFKSIKMTNFMSYGAIPTLIQLDQPGTTLLLGEDLDSTSSGSGSNGVGKTSILNALVYGLYDQPLSQDISKDNLVNHVNKKGMEVAVEFEKNGVNYLIIRCRKMKVGAAGNYTTVYENGKDVTLDSSNNTNAYIEKILGVPYELFVRIVAFSASQTPFLNLPVRSPYAANQTDIIEELFELKTLSEKAESLKIEIKDTEASVKTQLERVDALKGEHERHAKQLESAKRRVVTWEQTNASEIEDIKHRVEKLQNVNIEEQRELLESYGTFLQAKQGFSSATKEINTSLIEVSKRIHQLEDEMNHLYKGQCPRCHQKFHESHDHMAEMDRELSTLNLEREKLGKEKVQTAIDEASSSERLAFLEKRLFTRKIDELLETKNRIDNLNDKLSELSTTENPHLEVLQELEAIQLEAIDMSKINELKNTLDHQTFLLKLLTKKDSFVRKALLNKNIPFLNSRLQKYLSDLDLPHQVEFTHEMTASISRFGNPMDFGNLSNGQRARVNLALSFAFRDVLQSMHEFVNICMLDEVLDVGLDAVGVQAAARMLKRKARDEKLALYIISHRDEIDSAFDRKMIVQMSGGFSSIRYEDG